MAETAAVARYRKKHPFASASEINAERTRIRATSPGISRPYYDVTSSASKSISVLHASLRVAAGQARQAGDHVKAAALDGEAQAIEDALLDAVREGLELLEAMACYVRTGHHSKDTGEWRDGKGLVGTSWLHTISRDGDPQLHVHLAVLNAVSSYGSYWLMISSAVSKSSTMAARISDAAASLNLASNIATPSTPPVCTSPPTLRSAAGPGGPD